MTRILAASPATRALLVALSAPQPPLPTTPRPGSGPDVAPGDARSTRDPSGTSGTAAAGRRWLREAGYVFEPAAERRLTEDDLFTAYGLTGREREW
ncbi:MAG TPA: hypothetical protein VFI34_07500 [Candidatus Limnocylindrales bacterium]|nr:hypothetical protein [Candidatus Limnocylindrales bacterium]